MTSTPTSKLDILAGLPCVNSRKTAQTIIDELRGRGIHLVAEDEMAGIRDFVDEMEGLPPRPLVDVLMREPSRAQPTMTPFDSGLPGEGKVFRTSRFEPPLSFVEKQIANPYNHSFTFNPNDPFSTS